MRIQNNEIPKLSTPENDDEISADICGVIIGLFLSGIVYIAIFLPLILHSSKQIGVNPLDILLFAKYSPDIGDLFFNRMFPEWSNPNARSLVYAVGNFYGVIGIVCTFMIVSVRKKGIIDFIITSNGLCSAYFLTLYLSGNVFGIIDIDLFSKKMVHFRIGYILFAFYMLEFLKNLFKKKGLFRKKYEILTDGMFGMICTFILISGFSHSVISILTGPIFLMCLFLTLFITEQTLGRFIFGMIEVLKTSAGVRGDLDPKEFIKKFFKNLWDKIKLYKGQDIDLTLFPVLTIKLWTALKQNLRQVLIMSLIVFAINSIFPVLVCAIYHYALEGRF